MCKYIAVFMLAASTVWAQKPVIAVLDFEPISSKVIFGKRGSRISAHGTCKYR